MTFTEAGALIQQYRLVQAREDRRAALAAYVLANVNRDTETRTEPWELQEVVAWLGHGFEKPATPPTPDELLERIRVLQAMYHASVARNGQGGVPDG